jgi:anthranilate phosphoribosyltransferase
MWTDESLKQFGWNIQKLIDKIDLTRKESYEMFRQVLLNKQPDLQQGAFLSALTAKGETPAEMAGAWQAIVELDTETVTEDLGTPLVENSGTGMDQLKTFNVSSAAAIVAAAAGCRMARHGARALTSSCGTVDILESIGINVECGVDTVSHSIKTAGIGLFNGMSTYTHPQSLARILSQIRFGSTLNIAASLASPCRTTHALRGVYSAEMVPRVAKIMKAIGIDRAIVVHGFDDNRDRGMDELSNIGESIALEIRGDGSEVFHTIVPEEVGLNRSQFDDIAALGDVKKESVRFLKVIGGVEHSGCIDITCLNAGAVLYLVGKAKDISEGVTISKEIIGSGQALQKLVEWVNTQSDQWKTGMRSFLSVAEAAGIKHHVRAYI